MKAKTNIGCFQKRAEAIFKEITPVKSARIPGCELCDFARLDLEKIRFADVREWYDDDLQRFHIDVNVSHPRWGPLFGYTGWFVAQWPACPPGEVPASSKPVREESRE